MDKKGQMVVGGMVLMALAVIVVAALLPQIASNQDVLTAGAFTQTYPVVTANISNGGGYSTVSVSNTSGTALRGQEYTNTATIVNFSGNVDCTTNFTVSEGISSATNTKRVLLQKIGTTTGAAGGFCSQVNISYTGFGEGYVDDAGGRSISGLLVLFSVLALLGAVIYYFIKNNGWLSSFQ